MTAVTERIARLNPFARGGAEPAAVPAPDRMADPDGPLFDEELLGRLRRVALVSSHSIAEGLAGEHRSKRRGSSPEFADFKIYSQGDDFRRIDWNLYARLDDVFVRLSEVTTELTVHVLLDASDSMDWRGDEGRPSKFRYARQVAGSLCYVSLWHFDRVIVAPFGEDLAPAFGPAQGRAHVMPMLSFLSRQGTLGATDLPTAIERYVRARRRPGLMVVVSDLLSGEPEQLRERLRDLRARGWQTIVVHVVDDAELDPSDMGGGGGRPQPTDLIDLESGERLRIVPGADVLARYGAAVAAWLAEIEEVCAAERADYVRLSTSWPFDTVVLNLLNRRGLLA